MTSLALLILRGTVGGLLAGHGAQKLFGSFGGFGVEGTAGWLESLNFRPGRQWAIIAGLSEFGGGALTALGALNPLGPIMAMGAMLTATFKVHRGKPIWGTAGGAELPTVNMAVLGALTLAGPGKLSFDGLLGIRLPRWFGLASLFAMIASVGWAVSTSEARAARENAGTQTDEVESGAKLQGGAEETMDTTDNPAARPEVESWGTPDEGEPAMEDTTPIAAIRREEV